MGVGAGGDQGGEVGGRGLGVCAPPRGAGSGWRFVDGVLGIGGSWMEGGGGVIVGVGLAAALSEYIVLVGSSREESKGGKGVA